MSIQTVTQLHAALFPLVRHLVGEYVDPAGRSHGPAIVMGEPPGQVVGRGVEVRLPRDTPLSTMPFIGGEFAWTGDIPVRVIGHNRNPIEPVVRVILRAYPFASSSTIPEDYTVGILAQAVIRVPIH